MECSAPRETTPARLRLPQARCKPVWTQACPPHTHTAAQPRRDRSATMRRQSQSRVSAHIDARVGSRRNQPHSRQPDRQTLRTTRRGDSIMRPFSLNAFTYNRMNDLRVVLMPTQCAVMGDADRLASVAASVDAASSGCDGDVSLNRGSAVSPTSRLIGDVAVSLACRTLVFVARECRYRPGVCRARCQAPVWQCGSAADRLASMLRRRRVQDRRTRRVRRWTAASRHRR